MQLSTNNWPVGLYEKALPASWSWEERLAAAAQAGYDFVEISIDESDERQARLAWGPAQLAALRDAVAHSGMPLLTMCLSGARRYPMGSRSPEIRSQGLELHRRAIEFALETGVRIVQVGGYDVYYEPHDAGTTERLLDGFRQAAEWAGRAGVMLAVENVDVPVSQSMDACVALVQAVDSPWFQIYGDMANLAAQGFDPAGQYRLAGKHLVAAHVKDGLPNVVRGVPFGEGIVSFPGVFRALKDVGFSGPLLVEMWADLDRMGDPFGAVCAAREFVRRHVESS